MLRALTFLEFGVEEWRTTQESDLGSRYNLKT